MSDITTNTEYHKSFTQNITAAAQTVDISSSNQGVTSLQVTGSWVGTMVIEVSNTSTFVGIQFQNVTSATFVSSITANGIFRIPTNAFSSVQVRSSAWTSGTATLTVDGSDQPDFQFSSVSQGQLVPTITNKFKVVSNVSNITVPSAFTTLFTYSGTGLFFGFQAAFNNANINIRLTVDSSVVFNILLNDIKQFQFNDTGATRMQLGGFFTTVGNALDFSSKFAIPFSSIVTLDVQRSDGTDHTNNNWIVFLTEDS